MRSCQRINMPRPDGRCRPVPCLVVGHAEAYFAFPRTREHESLWSPSCTIRGIPDERALRSFAFLRCRIDGRSTFAGHGGIALVNTFAKLLVTQKNWSSTSRHYQRRRNAGARQNEV